MYTAHRFALALACACPLAWRGCGGTSGPSGGSAGGGVAGTARTYKAAGLREATPKIDQKKPTDAVITWGKNRVAIEGPHIAVNGLAGDRCPASAKDVEIVVDPGAITINADGKV